MSQTEGGGQRREKEILATTIKLVEARVTSCRVPASFPQERIIWVEMS